MKNKSKSYFILTLLIASLVAPIAMAQCIDGVCRTRYSDRYQSRVMASGVGIQIYKPAPIRTAIVRRRIASEPQPYVISSGGSNGATSYTTTTDVTYTRPQAEAQTSYSSGSYGAAGNYASGSYTTSYAAPAKVVTRRDGKRTMRRGRRRRVNRRDDRCNRKTTQRAAMFGSRSSR